MADKRTTEPDYVGPSARTLTRRVAVQAMLAANLPLAQAQSPAAPDKTDLFVRGTGDYAYYRIPGVVVTNNGTVLAYCEARKHGPHDWNTLDVLTRRSVDGGNSWSKPYKVSHVSGPKSENPAAVAVGYGRPYGPTYNNPVAIADRDGTVHLLYCLEYMRCFYVRSEDDGVTFSSPVEITSIFEQFRSEFDWKALSVGPGHGIQLRDGRLVAGIRLADAKGRSPLRYTAVATIFSDDGGAAWHRGEIAARHGDRVINPNEPVLVELADGRVMMNIRNESEPKRRLVSISSNGAEGWSTPTFDDALWDSGVMASIIRVDNGTLGFANPHSVTKRHNLTIKLSADEGKSWYTERTLESGPSAYCDLTVLPDGTILCLYERGEGVGPQRYGRITMARFSKAWVTD